MDGRGILVTLKSQLEKEINKDRNPCGVGRMRAKHASSYLPELNTTLMRPCLTSECTALVVSPGLSLWFSDKWCLGCNVHVPGDTSYEGQSYLLVEFLGYNSELTSALSNTSHFLGLLVVIFSCSIHSHKVPPVPTNSWAMCRPVWATPADGVTGPKSHQTCWNGANSETGHWSLLDFSCGIKESRASERNL